MALHTQRARSVCGHTLAACAQRHQQLAALSCDAVQLTRGSRCTARRPLPSPLRTAQHVASVSTPALGHVHSTQAGKLGARGSSRRRAGGQPRCTAHKATSELGGRTMQQQRHRIMSATLDTAESCHLRSKRTSAGLRCRLPGGRSCLQTAQRQAECTRCSKQPNRS